MSQEGTECGKTFREAPVFLPDWSFLMEMKPTYVASMMKLSEGARALLTTGGQPLKGRAPRKASGYLAPGI